MSIKIFSTAALGFITLGLASGCCTSGSCGSQTHTPETVYTTQSYDSEVISDCGCGCSAAVETETFEAESMDSMDSMDSAGSGSRTEPVQQSPYYIGDPNTATSEDAATEAVNALPGFEAIDQNGTADFQGGSSTRGQIQSLPGNLLPGN